MRQWTPRGNTVYTGFLSRESRNPRQFSTAILLVGNAVPINFRQKSYRSGKSLAWNSMKDAFIECERQRSSVFCGHRLHAGKPAFDRS